MPTLKVMHFVTGGFSGSTSVAIQLAQSSLKDKSFEHILVLRRKKNTTNEKINHLKKMGLNVKVVPGKFKFLTIFNLILLCNKLKPDILVCHGFSEHLWGRYAGLLARVPHLVHVEHNSRERYTKFRLLQAKWLNKYTDKIVACSNGVAQSLYKLNFPKEKIVVINNGVDASLFHQVPFNSYISREPSIVMASRFSKQKDHETLIKALSILKERDFEPKLYLAGTGNRKKINQLKKLVVSLNLENSVKFLGFCNSVPELLMKNKICVLISHYEGMPLSLIEGMAGGNLIIASDVEGVNSLIKNNKNGVLVAPQDPLSLANTIENYLLNDELSKKISEAARKDFELCFSLDIMKKNYNNLFLSLVDRH